MAAVIVKELVDNALDACEEAGIAPEIDIRVDAAGITVADNGPGLPAETIEVDPRLRGPGLSRARPTSRRRAAPRATR